MKKIISIILAAVMVTVMLAACGGGSAAPATTAAPAETTAAGGGEATGDLTGKKVCALFFSLEGEFFVQFDSWMREAFEAKGIEYTSQSSNMDDVTMIEQIENAVAAKNDLIWVWAMNGDVVHDACKAAKDNGTIVYAFVQDPGEDARDRARGTDEVECGTAIGELAVEWVDKNCPDAEDGSLKVLLMANESSTNQKIRSDSMEAVFANDPRFEIVEKVLVELSAVDGQNTAENMFAKYGDTIDVIACVSGNQVIGTCSYLTSEASVVADPVGKCVVGTEVGEDLANLMKEGLYDAAAVPGGNPYENMQVQIDEICRMLQGDQSLFGGFSSVDIGRATPENIADFGY